MIFPIMSTFLYSFLFSLPFFAFPLTALQVGISSIHYFPQDIGDDWWEDQPVGFHQLTCTA